MEGGVHEKAGELATLTRQEWLLGKVPGEVLEDHVKDYIGDAKTNIKGVYHGPDSQLAHKTREVWEVLVQAYPSLEEMEDTWAAHLANLAAMNQDAPGEQEVWNVDAWIQLAIDSMQLSLAPDNVKSKSLEILLEAVACRWRRRAAEVEVRIVPASEGEGWSSTFFLEYRRSQLSV